MTVISLNEIERLSIAERIQLVQDIWDTIWSTSEGPELTEQQRQELDLRFQKYEKEPEANTSWQEVKKRIRDKQ